MATEIPLASIKVGTGRPAAQATSAAAKAGRRETTHHKATKAEAAPAARPPLAASYQYNEAIRQVVVTLQRPDTGEVVAQLPPEQVVKFVTAMLQALRNMDAKA